MKKIFLVFVFFISLNAKDYQSLALINGITKSLEGQNCKSFYNFLSNQDRAKKSMNDFCFEFQKGMKKLENKKFTGEVNDVKNDIGKLKLTFTDKKTFETDSFTWDIVKENHRWFLNFKFKSKKEEEKRKKNLDRIFKLQDMIIYSYGDNVIYNYDKKLKLLNEYLELLKIENYGKDYEEKAKKIIKNTLRAKNIDKKSIKIINPTISKAKYDGYGFFAEIQNKTNEIFSTIILKVYLLDKNNNPIYDKQYKVYDLKQNYIKSIGQKIKIPSIWDIKKQNFRIEIEYMEIDSK